MVNLFNFHKTKRVWEVEEVGWVDADSVAVYGVPEKRTNIRFVGSFC